MAAIGAGVVGGACLMQVRTWRDAPMAAMPLLFAAQQAAEAAIWMSFSSASAAPGATASGVVASLAVPAFLGIAFVVWPLLAPAAALLIEPQIWRRRLMTVCLVLGLLVALRLSMTITGDPAQAILQAGRICYAIPVGHTAITVATYALATTLPLLASSYRAIVQVGAAIATGLAVSLAFYQASLPSVWCFFAALASVGLLLHFRRLQASNGAPAFAAGV